MDRQGSRPRRGAITVALVLLVATGLAACRDEEQGRIYPIEDEVYRGPTDQPLAEPQLEELQERGRLQSF